MPKSYGHNTPFVVSLIYDLNKIMTLFIKLKAKAKRYPLEIKSKESEDTYLFFYRQSSLVWRLKEHYVYYFALADGNLFYVRSLIFPPKGKVKVMEVTAFFSGLFFRQLN